MSHVFFPLTAPLPLTVDNTNRVTQSLHLHAFASMPMPFPTPSLLCNLKRQISNGSSFK